MSDLVKQAARIRADAEAAANAKPRLSVVSLEAGEILEIEGDNLPAVIPKDPVTGEPLEPGERIVTNTVGREFVPGQCWIADWLWQESELLSRVKYWADVRGVSPDAVLASIMVKYARAMPPQLRLQRVEGGSGGFGFGALKLGDSGAGKGLTADVVDELAPQLSDESLRQHSKAGANGWTEALNYKTIGGGTGEYWVSKMFNEPKQTPGTPPVEPKAVTNALIESTEVSKLAAEMRRESTKSGAILIQLLSGEDATNGVVSGKSYPKMSKYSYNVGILLDAQYGPALELMEHGSDGLSQRLEAYNADVSYRSADLTDDQLLEQIEAARQPPEKLDIQFLKFRAEERAGAIQVHTYKFADSVALKLFKLSIATRSDQATLTDEQKEIMAEFGDVAAASIGHMLHGVAKKSALLSLMHGETEVTEKWWRAAIEMQRVSERTWKRIEKSGAARAGDPVQRAVAADVGKQDESVERAIEALAAAEESYLNKVRRENDAGVSMDRKRLLQSANGRAILKHNAAIEGANLQPKQLLDRMIEEGLIWEDDSTPSGWDCIEDRLQAHR